MKIFRSEIHDTAFVFIGSVVVMCVMATVLTGAGPGKNDSNIMIGIASIVTLIYWSIVYLPEHLNDESNP